MHVPKAYRGNIIPLESQYRIFPNCLITRNPILMSHNVDLALINPPSPPSIDLSSSRWTPGIKSNIFFKQKSRFFADVSSESAIFDDLSEHWGVVQFVSTPSPSNEDVSSESAIYEFTSTRPNCLRDGRARCECRATHIEIITTPH